MTSPKCKTLNEVRFAVLLHSMINDVSSPAFQMKGRFSGALGVEPNSLVAYSFVHDVFLVIECLSCRISDPVSLRPAGPTGDALYQCEQRSPSGGLQYESSFPSAGQLPMPGLDQFPTNHLPNDQTGPTLPQGSGQAG